MEKGFKEQTSFLNQAFPINIFTLPAPDYIYVHWHEHLELVYIISGSLTMQIDTTFTEVFEGDVVFVNSKQVHSTKNESPGTKLIAIVFNERLLRNAHLDYTEHRYILPILNQEIHLPTFLERENRLTKQIVDSIIRLVCEFDSKMLGYELSIKSDLFKIFTAIIRYAHESVLNSSVIKRTLDSTHPLDGILQYLQSNLDKHISLTELARQYNVSASHFCRLFKGLTGNTLLKYLNQLRIQQAEKLLRESEMPISEIAERLGFSSLSHFERVFRKMHFSNPSAFRAKAKTSGIYIYDMN